MLFHGLEILEKQDFFGYGALKSLNFPFFGKSWNIFQSLVKISYEQFYHVCEISQGIVLVAFSV